MTNSWWETHHGAEPARQVYCTLWENFTIKETMDKDGYISYTVIIVRRWAISFEYIKLSKNSFFLIYQLILKSLDILNPRFVE